jgi:hypothetical protein
MQRVARTPWAHSLRAGGGYNRHTYQATASVATMAAKVQKSSASIRCGTRVLPLRLETMFLFFSNGVGIGGSIVISIVLTLLLVYACSGP